ncbi:MAG: hypothetical protein ACR2MU_05485 [Gaiellaceae bacterium]
MRSRLAWLLGGFALLGFFSRKRRQEAVLAPEPAADPRAEELRAKLAAKEPEPAAVVDEPADDPDERRRKVHEEGRAAAERMRGQAPTDA